MKANIFGKFKNIDEAFLHWYGVLTENIEVKGSRDGEVVGEVINAITVIENPVVSICSNNIRKMPMRYAVGELIWYLSASRDLKSIQLLTKAWDRMSDDGQTVNSNYGWCIKEKFGFDQWEYVKEKLKADSETRQAVIHIKTAEHVDSRDVNCTISLQFLIREGKLYMTTNMRSNDLWMGFPYDIFQFTCLQLRMAMELGVGVGEYTHIAGSLHLYKRDYEKSLENVNACNSELVKKGAGFINGRFTSPR